MMRRHWAALARRQFLALWFLLCTLPTGLACALLTPINMFPDEPAHIARADGLRYGEILGVPAPSVAPGDLLSAGVMMNAAIFNVLLTREYVDAFPDRPVSEAARRATQAVPWSSNLLYCPSQMVQYFPVFYAPAALGLLAGESLGLSPVNTVYLGRVAMLLGFAALGAAALALARSGQALLFAVLTLPTLVNLAASCNQDGMMTGACVLAAALLTRTRPGRAPGPGWAVALALLTAVACAKTPYAPLLLACLAPVFGPGLWRRAAGVILAGVLPGLWLLHTIHGGFIHYPRAAYHPGPLWPGDRNIWLNGVVPGDNVQVLLAHPGQILLLPLTSFAYFWPSSWPLLLGSVSWGNTPIQPWEYPCLALALCSAALGTCGERPAARTEDALLAGLAVAGGFIAMELSLYITFSLAGLGLIQGVNARYFLPLLPFLILILPLIGRLPWPARLPRLAPRWFALPAVLMAGINIYALPAYVFHLFRMPWPWV